MPLNTTFFYCIVYGLIIKCFLNNRVDQHNDSLIL